MLLKSLLLILGQDLLNLCCFVSLGLGLTLGRLRAEDVIIVNLRLSEQVVKCFFTVIADGLQSIQDFSSREHVLHAHFLQSVLHLGDLGLHLSLLLDRQRCPLAVLACLGPTVLLRVFVASEEA